MPRARTSCSCASKAFQSGSGGGGGMPTCVTGALLALLALAFLVEQALDHRGIEVGGEEAARGGAGQREHRAVPHVHVHGRRRLRHAHDGGAAVAPHRDRHRVADLLRQLGNERRGDVHRVGLLQADQPQLQSQRAEQIVAAAAVLLDQPEARRS